MSKLIGIGDDNTLPPRVLSSIADSDELAAAFVRFVDQNGDPLPPGSVTTIVVNTTNGEIDDIVFEEA
jgi:hypothetical protein